MSKPWQPETKQGNNRVRKEWAGLAFYGCARLQRLPDQSWVQRLGIAMHATSVEKLQKVRKVSNSFLLRPVITPTPGPWSLSCEPSPKPCPEP